MEELWDMKWRGEDAAAAAAAECLFHSSFQRGERRKRSSPRSLVAQRVSGLDLRRAAVD